MDGQFDSAGRSDRAGRNSRSGRGRKRRRKAKAPQKPAAPAEPVTIAARRPNSPLLVQRRSKHIAASASPKRGPQGPTAEVDAAEEVTAEVADRREDAPRRAARIVRPSGVQLDPNERERQRLLARLLASDGRVAISRAVNEYLEGGFELPEDQAVQLQMLEHFDEARALEGLSTMQRLLEREVPLKRPVLDQRLRRLEQYAEDLGTRELAADLRRSLRS